MAATLAEEHTDRMPFIGTELRGGDVFYVFGKEELTITILTILVTLWLTK